MLFQIKQIIKMFFQHVVFPIIYKVNCIKAVDDRLIILADAHHSECPPYMISIREKLNKENYIIKEMYQDISSSGSLGGIKFMISFMKEYPRAKAVFICDNFLPASSCKKRRKTILVQLWHGCGAFKKFGYDAQDDIPKGYRGNVYRNYDLVTVSSEYCIKYFESAMRIQSEGVVKAMGICGTDQLYDNDFITLCKDKFRYEHPNAVGKKVILWAPSFRGNAGLQKDDSIKIPGEDKIEELDSDKYYVIKSFHPHMLKDRVENSGSMSTRELMVCADLLVTDYSSVFFEFLLLDKPILFFAADYASYTDARGYYLDYNELPGELVTDNILIDKYVEEALLDSCSSARNAFKQKYMLMCDGNSTDRVLNYVKNRY